MIPFDALKVIRLLDTGRTRVLAEVLPAILAEWPGVTLEALVETIGLEWQARNPKSKYHRSWTICRRCGKDARTPVCPSCAGKASAGSKRTGRKRGPGTIIRLDPPAKPKPKKPGDPKLIICSTCAMSCQVKRDSEQDETKLCDDCHAKWTALDARASKVRIDR